MKKIRKIAVEQNFAAISVGKLNELNEYELQLGPDVKIPGNRSRNYGKRVFFPVIRPGYRNRISA